MIWSDLIVTIEHARDHTFLSGADRFFWRVSNGAAATSAYFFNNEGLVPNIPEPVSDCICVKLAEFFVAGSLSFAAELP